MDFGSLPSPNHFLHPLIHRTLDTQALSPLKSRHRLQAPSFRSADLPPHILRTAPKP